MLQISIFLPARIYSKWHSHYAFKFIIWNHTCFTLCVFIKELETKLVNYSPPHCQSPLFISFLAASIMRLACSLLIITLSILLSTYLNKSCISYIFFNFHKRYHTGSTCFFSFNNIFETYWNRHISI